MSKFKPGDKVEIVNYGHLSYIPKTVKEFFNLSESQLVNMYGITKECLVDLQKRIKPNNLFDEDDLYWYVELRPDLIGKEFIIKADKFSTSNIKDKKILNILKNFYFLENEEGIFSKNQLKLIK